MLDSSYLYVLWTRPRLTIVSLSEGHGGRMENRGLVSICDFLEDRKIQDRKWNDSLMIGQVSKTKVVEEDRYSLRIGNPR